MHDIHEVAPPSEALRRASGRDRGEWFTLLDAYGAAAKDYGELHAWLTGEHDLSAWWAQKLIVEYQQARGVRAPGVRPDGTFTITGSKTIAAPVADVWEAFVDAAQRESWLPGWQLNERTSQEHRSLRCDVGDGTRLSVDFAEQGDTKTRVAVEHSRLPEEHQAAAVKAEWREHLAALKTQLET